jgi:hypothetical protein
MTSRYGLAAPTVTSAVIGNLLYNEAKELFFTGWRRARKRLADRVLGPPYYYRVSNRKMVDRSLSRLRSVRRPATSRRVGRAMRRYGGRKRTYSRAMTRRVRARRAMGTNGPAFRTAMRRTRFRAELGQRMGYQPSKRDNFSGSDNTAPDKRLKTVRLVRIPYSDTDDVMNRRNGRIADVVGVKFRAWFNLKQNIVESSSFWDRPIQIRWAIINPMENAGSEADITGGTNFFVATSPGSDDTEDFPTTGTAFDYMNRKINSRRYGVLQQGTFLISNDPAASNTRVNTRASKFIKFYVPLKRQMKWGNNLSGGENDYPNANIHFVFWYCQQGDKDTSQKWSTDSPFDFHYEHQTYFRTPDILK